MSSRTAIVLYKGSEADASLSLLLDFLPTIGLSLQYPGTNNVKIQNEIGETLDLSVDELRALLRERGWLSFEWWWNDSEDLICAIRLVADVVEITIDLKGSSQDHQDRVMSCLRKIYDSLASQGTALGMMFSHYDDFLLNPWADVFSGKQSIEGELPDFMLLRREIGDRLRSQVEPHRSTREDGGNLVFERADWSLG